MFRWRIVLMIDAVTAEARKGPWSPAKIYLFTFFACARNFAHRFFVALLMFALAAADNTRFFTVVTSRLVESPKALAAVRIAVS